MSSGAATSLCAYAGRKAYGPFSLHMARERERMLYRNVDRVGEATLRSERPIGDHLHGRHLHSPSKKAKAIATPEDEPDAKQPFQGSAEDAAAAIVGAASKITTSAKATAKGEGAIERTAITRHPHAHDRLHGAQVKRKLLMDYGKLSPDERRAEALARFTEHGHLVDPSTVTCTADEWLPSLLLPDGRTIVYHVDPSATTTADLIAEAARLMQRPAADIRLLDRDGDRLGTAGGVALPRDEGGKRHRPATPGGVALARTGRVGPEDTLGVQYRI